MVIFVHFDKNSILTGSKHLPGKVTITHFWTLGNENPDQKIIAQFIRETHLLPIELVIMEQKMTCLCQNLGKN